MLLQEEACVQLVFLPEFRDRIEYFVKQVKDPKEQLIVILNADDINGSVLTSILMPDHSWKRFRKAHQTPYARGIVRRPFIQDAFDHAANDTRARTSDRIFTALIASRLRAIQDIAVVVMDFGTIAVIDARLVLS